MPPSALPTSRSYKRPSTLPNIESSPSISIIPDKSSTVVSRVKSASRGSVSEKNDKVSSQQEARQYYMSDFARALEPKVQIPRDSKNGRTPRKVEVERRKRLYSSQKIGELIVREAEAVAKEIAHTWRNSDAYEQPTKSLIVSGEDGAPSRIKILNDYAFEDFAELKYFDNTEFESRDIQDWLNIKSVHDDKPQAPIIKDGVQYAKIPIPGKAFNESENKWIDCLVLAYDHYNNVWKIQWRLTEGWGLEKKQLISDDVEEDQDAPVVLDVSNREGQNEALGLRDLDENEEWRHRFAQAKSKLPQN